jgi:hypothetical protein
MFADVTYVPAMSRFTPSPPEYDAVMHGGISPALHREPLSYGMPPPNDGVMYDMITSGSMAAAANPGFFTQEEARATKAVAAASLGGGCSRRTCAMLLCSGQEDVILKLYPRTPG